MPDSLPRAFVCGHPIGHSRSPRIHRYWLQEMALTGDYQPVDVAPEIFSTFLAELDSAGWCGGNVTIPHKEAAFSLVAERDAAAEKIGAVNTLWFERGRLVGGNTDAYGFAANLDAHTKDWRAAETAMVLGAGGAARAIIFALLEAGIKNIRVINRTDARAIDLAHTFGPCVTGHEWRKIEDLLPQTSLLINTTALGMAGKQPLAIDLSGLRQGAIVSDIVYTPLETPLLRQARERGLTAVDGLGMLLHQAAPGFARWFGKMPIVSRKLRAYIIADLEMIR